MGFVHVEYGHAEDGARLIGARRGIGHIVGANDQGDIGLREIAVDLVHFDEAVVRNVGFGEQHVHVAGHASSDRMDGEAHLDSLLAERVIKLANLVLRLRDSHAIAGNDDHLVGCQKDRGSLFRGRTAHRLRFLSRGGRCLHLAEGSEEHVGKGTVHRLRHDD